MDKERKSETCKYENKKLKPTGKENVGGITKHNKMSPLLISATTRHCWYQLHLNLGYANICFERLTPRLSAYELSCSHIFSKMIVLEGICHYYIHSSVLFAYVHDTHFSGKAAHCCQIYAHKLCMKWIYWLSNCHLLFDTSVLVRKSLWRQLRFSSIMRKTFIAFVVSCRFGALLTQRCTMTMYYDWKIKAYLSDLIIPVKLEFLMSFSSHYC